MLHMFCNSPLPQLPAAATGLACIRVGIEGTRAAGTGNGASVDRDVAPASMRAGTLKERRGPPCEAGAADAGIRTSGH